MKPFVVALSVLAVAAPSFALAASDADGYPPGLFEHSPLVDPDHSAKQARPSAPEGPSAHRSRALGKRSDATPMLRSSWETTKPSIDGLPPVY